MTAPDADALADALLDPLGVVADLVGRLEPTLGAAAVRDIAARVAAGRAKRRRLALALLTDPAVLTHGRSPAPRVVGELLVALRAAGATKTSAPRCADCDRQVRAFYRRGADWICSGCWGKQRNHAACDGCGRHRPVITYDRQGRPRCHQCPPDPRDPTAVLAALVARLDPAVPHGVVVGAIHRAVPAAQRRRVAWALEDRPELLTGAGAQAPLPAVLRLIDELCQAGATRIVRPACPHCRRVVRLAKRRDGQRICRACCARLRAERCAGCGAFREPATRDAHGRPYCPNCLVTDPVNQEPCSACGRRRRVIVRIPDGPRCARCSPKLILPCGVCGRTVPCHLSRTTGLARCVPCARIREPCTRCGRVQPVAARIPVGPFCGSCIRTDPRFRRPCQACGTVDHLQHGCCAGCLLDRRLRALLGDPQRGMRPELRLVYQTLAATDPPQAALRWLERSAATTVLADLAAGRRPLTHQALDELLPSRPVDHLRSVLVAASALPSRDEQLVRLERWIDRRIAELPTRDDQQLLRRYAVWSLLRRLRRRLDLDRATASLGQVDCLHQRVWAATTLLGWLRTHGLALHTLRQSDLDRWLATGVSAICRARAGEFIRWAVAHRLARDLELPTDRWTAPTRPVDGQQRWAAARRLLTDDTVKLEYRIVGLLVLLYAQHVSVISRLTLDRVAVTAGSVRLRLGTTPIVLVDPLAGLVRDLLAARRGHARSGVGETPRWLFPGGQPGQPINPQHLRVQLQRLGIRVGDARSAALLQLAADLPPAVCARLLGIHPTVAVAWQRAAGGDWTAYAAELSRRTAPRPPLRQPSSAPNDHVER